MSKSMSSFQLVGYSERGVFNAVFHEICLSATPVPLLRKLLERIQFPGHSVQFEDITEVEVMIEQSLSDFGDADAIILYRNSRHRGAIFVEGKVKSCQRNRWTTTSEWNAFKKGTMTIKKLSSSNLFTQLYHKVRFVSSLKEEGIEKLEAGVPFPACSTKAVRKIGNNGVVRKAVKKIAQHLTEVHFVSVLPRTPEDAQPFFEKPLDLSHSVPLDGWSVENWGYLYWQEVEEFCKENGLKHALGVFEFNEGQIY